MYLKIIFDFSSWIPDKSSQDVIVGFLNVRDSKNTVGNSDMLQTVVGSLCGNVWFVLLNSSDRPVEGCVSFSLPILSVF